MAQKHELDANFYLYFWDPNNIISVLRSSSLDETWPEHVFISGFVRVVLLPTQILRCFRSLSHLFGHMLSGQSGHAPDV
jgi:hypothetical protein